MTGHPLLFPPLADSFYFRRPGSPSRQGPGGVDTDCPLVQCRGVGATGQATSPKPSEKLELCYRRTRTCIQRHRLWGGGQCCNGSMSARGVELAGSVAPDRMTPPSAGYPRQSSISSTSLRTSSCQTRNKGTRRLSSSFTSYLPILLSRFGPLTLPEPEFQGGAIYEKNLAPQIHRRSSQTPLFSFPPFQKEAACPIERRKLQHRLTTALGGIQSHPLAFLSCLSPRGFVVTAERGAEGSERTIHGLLSSSLAAVALDVVWGDAMDAIAGVSSGECPVASHGFLWLWLLGLGVGSSVSSWAWRCKLSMTCHEERLPTLGERSCQHDLEVA